MIKYFIGVCLILALTAHAQAKVQKPGVER